MQRTSQVERQQREQAQRQLKGAREAAQKQQEEASRSERELQTLRAEYVVTFWLLFLFFTTNGFIGSLRCVQSSSLRNVLASAQCLLLTTDRCSFANFRFQHATHLSLWQFATKVAEEAEREAVEELRSQVKQLAGVALALEEGDAVVDGSEANLEVQAEAIALREQLDAEVQVRYRRY